MSKVKITGHASGSGTLTLTGPDTSSDRTITLPDATGTALMTDGSAASLTAIPAANITGTLPAISGANLTGVNSGGVTVAANWRQTGTTSLASGVNYLTANWEVADTYGYGGIGSALSESSGVFTFPSTGIYYISYSFYCTLENDDTGVKPFIAVTTDNSSYTAATYGSLGLQRSSGNYEISAVAQYLLDVTSTTNVKVKFGWDAEVGPASSVVNGSSNNNRTNFIAIKIGDT